MKLIVGIDFGTSTTVVRYKKEGTDIVLPVKDLNGMSDVIPSAIFRKADNNETQYGNEALSAYIGGVDGELITNFKMGLLEADEDKKNEKKGQIEEFLKFVYKRFSQEIKGLNPSHIDVYVSYPAKWSDSFVNFMKNAVGKAGFGEIPSGGSEYSNIYGINEPKAATYNLLHSHLKGFKDTSMLSSKRPMYVFMLDMGAGTTDIVIFRLKIDSSKQIEIDNLLSYPTVDNPNLCGGREIDKILSNYIIEYVKEETHIPELPEDFFNIDSAKFWKDQVVSKMLGQNVNVNLPQEIAKTMNYMPNGDNAKKKFILTRSAFETATKGHWESLYDIISSAIKLYKAKFNIGPKDIDFLFLTGGHSQWYTVPNLFNGEGVCGYIGKDCKIENRLYKALDFKKLREEPWRMFSDSLPHECVAKGLCLQDADFGGESETSGNITFGEVSANNIWIELEINNKKSKKILIAEVGDKLPIEVNKEIDLGIIKSDWQTEKNNDFRGTFNVYSGEKEETAIQHQRPIELNLSLFKSLFFGSKFIVKCSCDVTMNNDCTLSFSGNVSIDNTSIFANPDIITF